MSNKKEGRLTKESINELNDEIDSEIIKRYKEIICNLKEQCNKFSFEIKITKIITYLLSIVLIFFGIYFLYIGVDIGLNEATTSQNLDSILKSLGFGSTGGLTLISLLIINPAKKIQQANSDAMQAKLILHSWEYNFLLLNRAMDLSDRESMKEIFCKNEELTDKTVELLQKHYENAK